MPEVGAELPSVAILVDDLVTWLQTGLLPTGIQRVTSELLDTAYARPDIRAWPAVALAGLGSDDGLRLTEVSRDSLQWSAHEQNRELSLRSLRFLRRLMRSIPLQRRPRRLASQAYSRLAYAMGGFEVKRPNAANPPNLLLVPGGFWNGGSSTRIVGLARQGIRIRLIVYDLFPVRNPEWYPSAFCGDFVEAVDALIPVADRIVTMSAEVAEQIAERYPAVRARIRVGVPTLTAHAPKTGQGAGPDTVAAPVRGPFLLALSTVEPRKNHRVILDAWRIARKDPRLAEAWLVVAGRRGWKTDDIEAEIARGEKRLRMLRLSHVGDDEVEALYRDCIATVHASWSEGFGLPVRESIARGITTLMSSAIPRDGLPDGTYRVFDPSDAETLATLMIEAVVAGRVRDTVQLGDGTGWEPVLAALID